MNVHMYVHQCAYAHENVCISVYVHMYVCRDAFMYLCMYKRNIYIFE